MLWTTGTHFLSTLRIGSVSGCFCCRFVVFVLLCSSAVFSVSLLVPLSLSASSRPTCIRVQPVRVRAKAKKMGKELVLSPM